MQQQKAKMMCNRNSRDQESRMSMENSTSFTFLQKEIHFFDEEELSKVVQSDSKIGNEKSMSSKPPVLHVGTKRASVKEFEGSNDGTLFSGKDLVDVFQQTPDLESSSNVSRGSSNDRRESIMSLADCSMTSFRRSSNVNRETGNDRRDSMMSLMSLMDCSIIDNPSQLEETQDGRENVTSIPMLHSSQRRSSDVSRGTINDRRVSLMSLTDFSILENPSQLEDTQEGRENGTSMPILHSSQRRSSDVSLGPINDRRGSLMSLTDCSILEYPSQLEDTQDGRENGTSMPMLHSSQRRSIDISRGDFNDRRVSLMSLADFSILENPSQLEETQDGSANDAPSSFVNDPSAQRAEEDKTDNSDDHVEHIEKIGPYDIICGRNSGARDSIGNRRFRITIMMNTKKYNDAISRDEKTGVIKSVIKMLTDTEEVGARFIKRIGDGMYVRLTDKQMREKVGHAFRDMVSVSEKL